MGNRINFNAGRAHISTGGNISVRTRSLMNELSAKLSSGRRYPAGIFKLLGILSRCPEEAARNAAHSRVNLRKALALWSQHENFDVPCIMSRTADGKVDLVRVLEAIEKIFRDKIDIIIALSGFQGHYDQMVRLHHSPTTKDMIEVYTEWKKKMDASKNTGLAHIGPSWKGAPTTASEYRELYAHESDAPWLLF